MEALKRVLVPLAQPSATLAEAAIPVMEARHMRVTSVMCKADAIRSVNRLPFDVSVLAPVLADGNGVALAQHLAASYGHRTIMIAESRAHVVDAYEATVDDCIRTPVDVIELLYRVLALTQRGARTGSSRCEIGPLVLDSDRFEASAAGARLDLTATEFRLLRVLMTNSGKVLSKGHLQQDVWCNGYVSCNTVERHVSALRAKLRDCGMDHVIQTVRGFGYRVQPFVRES